MIDQRTIQGRGKNLKPYNKRKIMLACIIGSGPSGVYIAENLIKSKMFSKIDMIDNMRQPFGFVKYGVAPDRPEIKVQL